MSWTKVNDPFEAFRRFASNARDRPLDRRFRLGIWEHPLREGAPGAGWRQDTDDITLLERPCDLRIVFAPLDLPNTTTIDSFTRLYNTLGIPPEFAHERTRSVSHSFGTRTDSQGGCAWFHFLCKNIQVAASSEGKRPEIEYHSAAEHNKTELGRLRPGYKLPQDDASYIRSAFFFRVSSRGATLVVFGNTLATTRLKEFIGCADAWGDAVIEPYVLFEIIFEGLYNEIEDNVRNLHTVYRDMEFRILTIANDIKNKTEKIPFVGLHNVAKHMIHLREALESTVHAVDSAAKFVEARGAEQVLGTDDPSQRPSLKTSQRIRTELKQGLKYRRSVFRSIELRLASLEKRIDSTINLSFNTVTQQDSKLVKRDSKTMTAIAAITLVFLPTTAVASVMGSQLFLANNVDGSWSVSPSPLFPIFCYLAITFTVAGITVAVVWQWVIQRDRPRKHAGNPNKHLVNSRGLIPGPLEDQSSFGSHQAHVWTGR